MYNALIFDTLNFAYKSFSRSENKILARLNSTTVQLHSVKLFIDEVSFLEKKFLKKKGQIYFLFDNPTSRDELKSLFVPLPATTNRKAKNAEYKNNRVRQSPQFYASVDFVKYYYMISDSHYRTVRVVNLEADDLVKPCLNLVRKNFGDKAKSLLISDGSDWCRYASSKTHYLPDLHSEPKTDETFLQERGYEATEEKIILEKVLTGDKTDNVAAVYPEIDRETRKQILNTFESTQDFVDNGEKHEFLSQWKKIIPDRLKEAKATYQMLATIPISDEQFRYNCVIGRNAEKIRESFDKSIKKGLRVAGQNNAFDFRPMKTPRVNPREEN
jgi:5'-3' exonuclease